MFPGIAALLLQRGCPEDHLDAAFEIMRNWRAPESLSQAVQDCDNAIVQLDAITPAITPGPIETTAT